MAMDRRRSLTEEMVFLRSKCNRLDGIKNLNLWGNDLQDISVLRSMPNLEVLSLSVNRVTSLSDLCQCSRLSELYLRKNNVCDMTEVRHLKPLRHLKVLWLSDNPCATLPHYRQYVLHHLPSLSKLDSQDVTPEERRAAAANGDKLGQAATRIAMSADDDLIVDKTRAIASPLQHHPDVADLAAGEPLMSGGDASAGAGGPSESFEHRHRRTEQVEPRGSRSPGGGPPQRPVQRQLPIAQRQVDDAPRQVDDDDLRASSEALPRSPVSTPQMPTFDAGRRSLDRDALGRRSMDQKSYDERPIRSVQQADLAKDSAAAAARPRGEEPKSYDERPIRSVGKSYDEMAFGPEAYEVPSAQPQQPQQPQRRVPNVRQGSRELPREPALEEREDRRYAEGQVAEREELEDRRYVESDQDEPRHVEPERDDQRLAEPEREDRRFMEPDPEFNDGNAQRFGDELYRDDGRQTPPESPAPAPEVIEEQRVSRSFERGVMQRHSVDMGVVAQRHAAAASPESSQRRPSRGSAGDRSFEEERRYSDGGSDKPRDRAQYYEDNILCAVLALVKELDRQGVELVRRAVETRQREI